MASSAGSLIGFRAYIKQLSRIVVSSTSALGLIVGLCLLLIGEISMNFDVGMDLSSLDGLLVMVGLPTLSLVLFVILSPLSSFIYKLLPKGKIDRARPDV